MLRYVVAVALAAALLAIGGMALDYGAAVRGESEVDSAVATIDDAAVSLVETERPPVAGERPPKRIVEIELPHDGLVQSPTEHLTFERVGDQNVTRVAYRIEGRTNRTDIIHAPLRHESGSLLELGGRTGPVRLELRLVTDSDDRPFVSVTVDA